MQEDALKNIFISKNCVCTKNLFFSNLPRPIIKYCINLRCTQVNRWSKKNEKKLTLLFFGYVDVF